MCNDDNARSEIVEGTKHGYTIIPDIFFNLGLDPLELLLLGAVHRYSQNGQKLILSPNQAAKVYNKSPNTIKKAFKNLIDKGLIFKESGNTQKQIANKYWLNYTTLKTTLDSYAQNEPRAEIDLGQKLPKARSKIALDLGQNLPKPRSKTAPYNRYIIDNNRNIIEYAQKDIAQSSVSPSQEQEKDNQPDRADQKEEPARSHKKKDTAIYEKQFEIFWKEYPKKRDRKKALEKWLKLKPDEELFKKIMQAVQSWKKSDDWQKDGGQFIPYPTSWLNGERWNDEAPAPPKQSRRSAQEYIPKADPIYQHTQEPIPDI